MFNNFSKICTLKRGGLVPLIPPGCAGAWLQNFIRFITLLTPLAVSFHLFGVDLRKIPTPLT